MHRLRAQFPLHATVTQREQQVLALLLHGLNQPEVARELGLAPSTVRMHVKHLHAKTSTRNLHALVLWAVAHGECCAMDEADR